MSKKHQIPPILMALCFLFFGLTTINGQATRTWVSGVGDDVNPCSRTAPCKTFAGAISKTAATGEINCLDPAGYGAVTITKSITIDCTGTFGSILGSGTNGIVINVAAGVVRIRGLSINGGLTGVDGLRVLAAGKVSLEDVVIDGFTQNGVSVENTGDVKVTINKATIRNNNGAAVNGNSAGTADITVVNSLLSGNDKGIGAGANSTIRISGNSILYNTIGLSVSQGKIVSFQNNVIDGNGTNGAPTSKATLQ
jgi:Right handed beta helix region